MLAVYHHYQGSNPTQGMCESWPWLGIWSSPVSSTSYNWLVKTQLQYGRKSDDNRNCTLLWEIQAGSASWTLWPGTLFLTSDCSLYVFNRLFSVYIEYDIYSDTVRTLMKYSFEDAWWNFNKGVMVTSCFLDRGYGMMVMILRLFQIVMWLSWFIFLKVKIKVFGTHF